MLKFYFIKELEKILKEEYFIYAQKIYKSKESTVGNVYIIETKENKYIAKLYDNLNHTKSMIDVYTFLKKNNLYIPKVIKNKLNLYYTKFKNKKFIVIYSYLEGVQIKQILNNFTSEAIKELASYLRRFHELTNKKNKFKLIESPVKVTKKIDRYSAIHFDLTGGNIFYEEKNNKIGLIDFDDAKYGQCIIDVAIAVGNLFFSKRRGSNIEDAKIFIDAYYGDNLELKQEELPYIKESIIKWINYITNTNEFDSSTKDSFKIRKELVSKVDFIKL